MYAAAAVLRWHAEYVPCGGSKVCCGLLCCQSRDMQPAGDTCGAPCRQNVHGHALSGVVQEYAPGGDVYGALAAAGGFLHEAQAAGGVVRPLLSALAQLHSQARIPTPSRLHMLTCRFFSRCTVRYRSDACAAAAQVWSCCGCEAGITLCEHCLYMCIYKILKESPGNNQVFFKEYIRDAWNQGVMHRDVKPENLLLCAGPGAPGGLLHVRLADFGLARRVGSGGTPYVGTLDYMAPEVTHCLACCHVSTRTQNLYHCVKPMGLHQHADRG